MGEREDFGRRQAEMTARWMSNLVAQGGDHGAHIEARKRAYMDRWREAARFVPDGARILDVGGGNLWPGLIRFFKDRGFDYWYMDVDPDSVASSAAVARDLGFDGTKFVTGFNDQFAYDDASFDAVFSSHCLEHSFDLATTFAGLWRILKPGGALLMAVPFGWEANPEHPYFLGPSEWCVLVEDAGFEIRVAQVGREYPESGYDYFIAARKTAGPIGGQRLDPADYRKTHMSFLAFDDDQVRCESVLAVAEDHLICDGDWSMAVAVPPGARVAMPILANHPWSAIVELGLGGENRLVDLHSWFSFVKPERLVSGAPGQAEGRVTIRPAGRNPLSRGNQCAFFGLLYR